MFFINTFYIFKRELTFSLLTCKNKNVQIFLWLLFDCCVFYMNVNDCDIFRELWVFLQNSPVGWGSGCDSVFCLSQWLGAPSCQRGSYAFYKSVSSRAQPDGPVQVWKLGEFYFIRCGPQDPACIAEVRKLHRDWKCLLSSLFGFLEGNWTVSWGWTLRGGYVGQKKTLNKGRS